MKETTSPTMISTDIEAREDKLSMMMQAKVKAKEEI